MNTTDSPVGLFRRDITDPKQLVATTIAREHLINDLLEKLENRGSKKSGQNHLFIGPRGIGKTHLLSLLEQSINSHKILKKQYTLIRSPEESNRILSFADLLLGIIDRLADVEEDEQKVLLRELHEKLETEEKDEEIIDYIVPRLKHWHKQTGKELSQEQTLTLVRSHFEWDKREDLLEQFEDLKPRVLAMHTLTGGNPRLIMMLYELIAQDNLNDIITRFHQLLDRITPFYQDRIKDLSPQERALLETIALMRTQQRTPVNYFIS